MCASQQGQRLSFLLTSQRRAAIESEYLRQAKCPPVFEFGCRTVLRVRAFLSWTEYCTPHRLKKQEKITWLH